MSFLKGDLLARMRLLIKGGIREEPKWFEAVKMIPPQPIKQRPPRAPKIVLPEDPFVESFYARNPEARLEHPFSLLSYDPPIARRFALRALELMPQARRQILEEMQEDIATAQGDKVPLEAIEWNGTAEKRARAVARAIVEGELEEAQIADEEERLAERRKALRAGKEPPPQKRNMLEEAQEEDWEALKHGLDVLGEEIIANKGRLG